MTPDEIDQTPDTESVETPAAEAESTTPAEQAEPAADAAEAADTPKATKADDAPQAEADDAPKAAKADDAPPAEGGSAEESSPEPAPAKRAPRKRAAKPAAEAEEAAAEEPKSAKAAKPAAKPAKRAPRKPAATAAEPAPRQRAPRAKREEAVAEPHHGEAGVANVVDADGKPVETRKLAPELFAVPADINQLHLVVRAEQAARRRGTASTKTRGEVAGSTAKLYRQKGTGRARAGSAKSPTRTGGGITFGPHPRSFDIKINRKQVRKALAMALTNRAENGNLYVATGLELDVPSTARANEFLVNLDIAAPVLVVTDSEPGVSRSVRNLPYAETTEVRTLSTEQVLRARSLVLTEKAFAVLSEV